MRGFNRVELNRAGEKKTLEKKARAAPPEHRARLLPLRPTTLHRLEQANACLCPKAAAEALVFLRLRRSGSGAASTEPTQHSHSSPRSAPVPQCLVGADHGRQIGNRSQIRQALSRFPERASAPQMPSRRRTPRPAVFVSTPRFQGHFRPDRLARIHVEACTLHPKNARRPHSAK